MMPKIGYPIADILRRRIDAVYGWEIPLDQILQIQDVYRVMVANGSINSIGDDRRINSRSAIAVATEINPMASTELKNIVNMVFTEAVNEIAAGNISPVYFLNESWDAKTEQEQQKHIAETKRNAELTRRALEKAVPAEISANVKKTVIILGGAALLVGGLYAASLYTANRAIR